MWLLNGTSFAANRVETQRERENYVMKREKEGWREKSGDRNYYLVEDRAEELKTMKLQRSSFCLSLSLSLCLLSSDGVSNMYICVCVCVCVCVDILMIIIIYVCLCLCVCIGTFMSDLIQSFVMGAKPSKNYWNLIRL